MCLDCSRWLLPCILHPSTRTRWRYRMGGGSAGGGGSTMEFFFPKAYAPGPSQLWLCSGTLFPSSCRPGRPALFLDQDFNTQWHCIPLLSSHSSPEFSSSSSPCRVGQLAGPPASLSQFSAPKRFAVHLLTRCRDLARAGLPPPSCRVGRRRDPAVFGRLSSTSNRAQRGQERY